MTIKNRTLVSALAVVLTGFMALAGYQAHALSRMAQLEPAVVATVDLLRVFDEVEEKAAAVQDLEAELQKLIDERNRRNQLLNRLEADLQDYPPGTQQYKDAQERLVHEALRFDGWSKFATRKMDLLNGEAMQKVYLSIKAQAASIAEKNGYDLVLVDDELAQFIPGTEAEIMRQIASRRMLFSGPRIDITDDIINIMNAGG